MRYALGKQISFGVSGVLGIPPRQKEEHRPRDGLGSHTCIRGSWLGLFWIVGNMSNYAHRLQKSLGVTRTNLRRRLWRLAEITGHR